MTNPLQNPALVDFVERIGATAFEAGAAIYIADPHAGTAKAALIAAGIAAAKYLYLKVGTWQAAQVVRPVTRRVDTDTCQCGSQRVVSIATERPPR